MAAIAAGSGASLRHFAIRVRVHDAAGCLGLPEQRAHRGGATKIYGSDFLPSAHHADIGIQHRRHLSRRLYPPYGLRRRMSRLAALQRRGHSRNGRGDRHRVRSPRGGGDHAAPGDRNEPAHPPRRTGCPRNRAVRLVGAGARRDPDCERSAADRHIRQRECLYLCQPAS